MANVLINQGTQTSIAADTVGTINYQIIKLDVGTAGDSALLGTANPLPSTFQTQLAGENLTHDVIGVIQKPVVDSTYSPSLYTNFGAVAGTVVKASAGILTSVYVSNISSALVYFQVFNSTTTPANGGTPRMSFPVEGTSAAAAVGKLILDNAFFAPIDYMGTGVAWALSSTNGTLGTASITPSNHNVIMRYA